MKDRYIGIDLGTSSIKLLSIDTDGDIKEETSEEYPLYHPFDGYSEQNVEDYYSGMISCLKRMDLSCVKAISFSGQMHGLVTLDKDDKPIRPCILWNDSRSYNEVKYLNSLGIERYTGNIAFAGFTANKILWMKKNEPDNFKKIAKIMLPKDYLVYRLTKQFATDYSDASGTLLLDVENKCWSKEMLSIVSLREDQLPILHESYDVIGKLDDEIKSLLNIDHDIYVVMGAGDNAAAAVGTNTLEDEKCNISLGTSGTIFISTDRFVSPENKALHSFCHASGKYHLMGCILSAASANKWWIEDILKTSYDIDTKGISLPISSVYFLPYLSGERCPHNDVSVRGSFIGLSSTTTREDMSIAVLEGISFALRDCIEIARRNGINITKCTVCGGGSKSKLWLKILANVLKVDLYTIDTEQGPSFGACILAMAGLEKEGNVLQITNRLVHKTLFCKFDEGLSKLYDDKYQRFKKLYPALKEFYKE